MSFIELFGYFGTVLIAISLTMSNIVRLRWINLFGASSFAIYGAIINAYPVMLLNGFISLVDVFYLIQIYTKKDYFSILEINPKNNYYLRHFLDFYHTDIKKFFPNFNYEKVQDAKSIFILRNMVPAGLFMYKEVAQDKIEIKLDYAIPDYRDFNNSKYFYSSETRFLRDKGYKTLLVESEQPVHQKYLLKMGFKKESETQFTMDV